MKLGFERMRFASIFVLGAALCASAPTAAQTTIAPLVDGDDSEFKIEPLTAGSLRIRPQVNAATSYDSNVLASTAGNEIDDLQLIVIPEVGVEIGDDQLRLNADMFAQFSRFLDLETENTETYGAVLGLTYNPSQTEQFGVQAGFQRLAENRGDAEARNIAPLGPRLFDNTFVEARYRRQGGRILLDMEAELRKSDAVSILDNDRDFTSYGSRVTLGYRASGPVYATATGFITFRDFVLPGTATDPSRNATTYGGRVGLNFVDSDNIRGRVGVGVFQFDPKDARLEARSGLSVDASVSVLLKRRLALTFDAFRGDVATFRTGAQARTDTRVSVGGQVEMRHNFYGRVGLRYRESDFIGSGITEQAYGPEFSVEYLANRNLSLIAGARVSERVSDDVSEEFERFRLELTARMRF